MKTNNLYSKQTSLCFPRRRARRHNLRVMHSWVFTSGLVGSSVCVPVVSCTCELFVATEPMRLENWEGALFVIDTVTVSIGISPPALHWRQREEAQLRLLTPWPLKTLVKPELLEPEKKVVWTGCYLCLWTQCDTFRWIIDYLWSVVEWLLRKSSTQNPQISPSKKGVFWCFSLSLTLHRISTGSDRMEIFGKITFGKIRHLTKSLWSWEFLTAVRHFARFKTYSRQEQEQITGRI